MDIRKDELNVAFKNTRIFLDGTVGDETFITLEPIDRLTQRTSSFITVMEASLTPTDGGYTVQGSQLDVTGKDVSLDIDISNGYTLKRFHVKAQEI